MVQGVCGCIERSLGRVVRAPRRVDGGASDGGEIDDVTGTADAEMRDERLSESNLREEVHLELMANFFHTECGLALVTDWK